MSMSRKRVEKTGQEIGHEDNGLNLMGYALAAEAVRQGAEGTRSAAAV